MTALRLLPWLLCALIATKLIDWLLCWSGRLAATKVWPVEKLKR